MIKPTNGVAMALAALMATSAVAQEMDYGNFDGYVLRVKLIGGAQYEPLYAEIPKWEAMTGATVDVLSRKNHFELDREIKQDIAAGTLDWCVGSNHTSFALPERNGFPYSGHGLPFRSGVPELNRSGAHQPAGPEGKQIKGSPRPP